MDPSGRFWRHAPSRGPENASRGRRVALMIAGALLLGVCLVSFVWLTNLLHRFPDDTPFDLRTRENQFDYLAGSANAQASLAEQYVGLPFEA